jgi:TPR repeat protein
MFIKKVINNICFLTIISNVISKNLITSMDEEEYKKLCEEGDPIKCYEVSMQTIKNNEFILVDEIEKIYDEEEKESLREFNSILSDHWYYAGQIEYFGIVKKKPNIAEGFSKFLISAFYGNPKSLYKLYILIESDIIKFIIETKEFENIKENSISSSNLNYIFNTTNTNFSLNFNYDDDYEKNSIAIQFLYSSALFKYQPAMTTLAYKFYKGYGVSRSCDAALRYYKEASTQNVKEITSRKKPNFYEKINIATYEYVGHKFSNEIMDIDDIIDYFKVEAQNGQINYIQQLGQRYLYGQGIVQDFNQAFYYFQIGSRLNDSTCIYYLGEMYLNGWGVEKVNL